MNAKAVTVLLLTWLASACASSPPHTSESAKDRFRLLASTRLIAPDPMGGWVDTRMRSGEIIEWKQGTSKAELCRGTTPKYPVSYKLSYSPPNTAGRPIDEAMAIKRQAISKVRDFLKTQFFYIGGKPNRDRKIDLELDGGITVHEAIEVPHFELVNNLMSKYTFKIPRPAIAKLMGYKAYDPAIQVDTHEIQYWGYDYESGQWSAALAIQNAENMWEDVLSSQTEVKEAPQSDGSVNFEATFDLAVFCRYAIPVSDLISGD